MPINRSTDVTLRVLMTLSHGDSDKTTISQLSESIGVPERYVGKLVQKLSSIGWVQTTRGRGGGISISPSGRELTPAKVIEAWGEGWPDIDCLQPRCPLLATGCRLLEMINKADAMFMAALNNVSMGELAAS